MTEASKLRSAISSLSTVINDLYNQLTVTEKSLLHFPEYYNAELLEYGRLEAEYITQSDAGKITQEQLDQYLDAIARQRALLISEKNRDKKNIVLINQLKKTINEKEIALGKLKQKLQEIENGSCSAYANGDPHYCGFFGQYYDVQPVGDYVLLSGNLIEIHARHHKWASSSISAMTSLVFQIENVVLEYNGPKNIFLVNREICNPPKELTKTATFTSISKLCFEIEIKSRNTKIIVHNSGGNLCMLSFHINTNYTEVKNFSSKSLLGNFSDYGKSIAPVNSLFFSPYDPKEAGIPVVTRPLITEGLEFGEMCIVRGSGKSAEELLAELEKKRELTPAQIRNLWFDYRCTPVYYRYAVISANIDAMKVFKREEIKIILNYEECLELIKNISISSLGCCRNRCFTEAIHKIQDESSRQKLIQLFGLNKLREESDSED